MYLEEHLSWKDIVEFELDVFVRNMSFDGTNQVILAVFVVSVRSATRTIRLFSRLLGICFFFFRLQQFESCRNLYICRDRSFFEQGKVQN